MTDLNSPFWIDYQTGLECPVCKQSISVKAKVNVNGGNVHQTSSDSFRAYLSVNLNTKIERIRISHECEYEEMKRER
jgi:hypothetical protein